MTNKFDTRYRRVDRATFAKVEAVIMHGVPRAHGLADLFASGVPANGYTIDEDSRVVSYLDVAFTFAKIEALADLIRFSYQDLHQSGRIRDEYMQYHDVIRVLIDNNHSFASTKVDAPTVFWMGAHNLDVEYLTKLGKLGVDFNRLSNAAGVEIPDITRQAIFAEKTDTLEKLLLAGAAPETRGTGGMSVLHGAVTQGKSSRKSSLDSEENAVRFEKILRAVLDAGGGIDMADDMGQSALHVACKLGYFNKARSLIEAGADMNLQDKDGLTPHDLARISKRRDVLQLFAATRAKSAVMDVVAQAAAASKSPSKH